MAGSNYIIKLSFPRLIVMEHGAFIISDDGMTLDVPMWIEVYNTSSTVRKKLRFKGFKQIQF